MRLGVTANTHTVVFTAAGDICFSDNVEKQIRERGEDCSLGELGELLRESDVAFANLEGPLTQGRFGRKGQAHLLKASPDMACALKNMGIDIVSVANNHILDFGKEGMEETFAALEKVGIAYVGAGHNLAEARNPVVITRKGIRFGFLAYAMKGIHSADANRPGAARMVYEEMEEDVGKIRPKVDVLVTSIHTGMEFIDYPHPKYREESRRLVEGGVDLILGHHPHVIQGMEKIGKRLIMYSLGNVIFDRSLMDFETELSREGFIFTSVVGRKGIGEYRITPVRIDDRCRPVVLQDAEAKVFRERLKSISAELTSANYPGVYLEQARKLWPYINIRLNLQIIREQGIVSFLKRLPRLKMMYVMLVLSYFVMIVKQLASRIFIGNELRKD